MENINLEAWKKNKCYWYTRKLISEISSCKSFLLSSQFTLFKFSHSHKRLSCILFYDRTLRCVMIVRSFFVKNSRPFWVNWQTQIRFCVPMVIWMSGWKVQIENRSFSFVNNLKRLCLAHWKGQGEMKVSRFLTK